MGCVPTGTTRRLYRAVTLRARVGKVLEYIISDRTDSSARRRVPTHSRASPLETTVESSVGNWIRADIPLPTTEVVGH